MGQIYRFSSLLLVVRWRNIESEAERKTFRQIRFLFSPIEDKLCTGKQKKNQSDVFSDEIVFLFTGSVDTMGKLVVYFPSSCCHRSELGGTSGSAHRYQSIHFTRLWFIDRCYFKKTRNTEAKWVSRWWSHSGSALGNLVGGDLRVPLPACSCCRWWKRHSAWKTSLACHWPTSMPSIIFHQDFLSIIANANCTATADLMMSDDKVQNSKKNKPLKMRS